MKKIIAALIFAPVMAMAQAGQIEAGIGLGKTHPTLYDNFENMVEDGHSNNYWIGYGLTDKWAAELEHDSLDFNKALLSSKIYSLGLKYNFNPANKLNFFAKLGLGFADHKTSIAGVEAKDGLATKAAIGANLDLFKHVSFQAGIAYHLFEKVTSDIKTSQAVNPYLAIVFNFDGKATVASAKAAVAKVADKVASKDTDKDGVSDDDDKCPNTTAGVVVNAYGCAETEKASIAVKVLFESGKAVIKTETLDEVTKLSDFMKKYPETNVHIKGYTDNTGKAETNKKISIARAEAVKAELVKSGIAANRIEASGYGPADPIADNKTAEGRMANRRVVAEIKTTAEKKK